MEKGTQQPIIIRKRRRNLHGAHGGSWKVALADFMTAMMAFFLLLWLLGSTTPEQRKAISGYFLDPSNKYVVGEGGADLGVIPQDQSVRQSKAQDPDDTGSDKDAFAVFDPSMTDDQIRQEMERIETAQLEGLKDQIEAEINSNDAVFALIKDQILIDFTALGLRIQIVDKEQRPMFDLGSANLQRWSKDVLTELAPILNKVKNKISITGHTDSLSYSAGAVYSNWELSADRANAARRALLGGGYPEAKVATVQGMGAAAPLLPEKPSEPVNRRIAIIVLKKAVSDAMISTGGIDSRGLFKAENLEPQTTPTPPPRPMTPQEIEDAIDTTSP